ncbi:Disease resistance protein RPS5 [Vitis vinifera]|uniref:Disease resistance protein RPS5 n=1 Tax=Vitis vinifera TaxID=29760 RepID=A0A438E574_VITVI|nr:Disease resistance protein RPS5 [Vitis vinifera]
MEYVEAVLTSIGLLKDMWPSISKCFNYHKILDKNCKTLKEKMERLKSREQDDGARSWKGKNFLKIGFLRQSEEHIEKIDELLECGRFPEGILIDVLRDEGRALLTTQLIGETTTKRNLEKIWTCLEKDTFGLVYWVTVSKDSSIRKLQDVIAEKINLDLSKEEDERLRSALLFEALQKEKKFVLIFDDVWEVYPPREVGIPIGVDGGKLIITTRSREVCLKMGCKEIIKVEPLYEEEAWELFNKTLERYNALSQKEEK